MAQAERERKAAQVRRARTRQRLLKGVKIIAGCFLGMLAAFGVSMILRKSWAPIAFTPAVSAPLMPLPTLPPIPDGSYELDEEPLPLELIAALEQRMWVLITRHPDPRVSSDLFKLLNEHKVGFWYRHAADKPESPAAFGLMDSGNIGSDHRQLGKLVPIIRVDSYSLVYGTNQDIRNLLMALPHEKVHFDRCMALSKPDQEKYFKFDGPAPPCAFLWQEELAAYAVGCRSIVRYGLTPLTDTPYCLAVDEPAAFAQQLFRFHEGHLRSCRREWARLAGHPYWWAYVPR